MKTALIVDSVCSLPKSICEKYNISLLPVHYKVNGDDFEDECDEQSSLAIFETGVFGRKYDVSTTPPSPEDFEQEIIKKIKEGNKRIVIQTLNRFKGNTYGNANAGVARVKTQLEGQPITMRVMDSRTVFAGQGLMATETVRRLLKEGDENSVQCEMDLISKKIHTFILPREPLVALERSRERNENNIGWAQALIADALGIHPIVCNVNDASDVVAKIWSFNKAASALFEHVRKRIDIGLASPIITVNYCGALKELKSLPGYHELAVYAKQRKVMLIPSVASLASGIYTSVGSLSIAIATDKHEWFE